MKIYDCVIFFNEIELLELRLEILNQYIDKFVIVESNVTFSGNKKEFVLEKNLNKFDKFKDKIIYKKIQDTPDNFINLHFDKKLFYFENDLEKEVLEKILKYINNVIYFPKNEAQWGRETFQRECILRSLINCNDEDIIILSDLDEIPNVKDLLNYIDKEDVVVFKQKMFYYFLNFLVDNNWIGSKACRYKYLKNTAVSDLRLVREKNKCIENGGWHFSYLGGEQQIRKKIEAYSHQEYNNDSIKNNILSNIQSGKDLFGRNMSLTVVELDNFYPKYILDNVEKYKNWIK
jgi:beta-1,4-mannosyl-glycoprotein beta-1,4-N-acetylglucosaminyltransferase